MGEQPETPQARLTPSEGAVEPGRLGEADLRILLEQSDDVIVRFDQQGVIEYVSPSVRRYGYAGQEIVGASVFSLLHPDDAAGLTAFIANVFSSGRSYPSRDRSYRVRTAGGSLVWVESGASIVRDDAGHPCAVISQMRDIDARRRAQDALAESEARYRIIAENVTDVISRIGIDGTTRYQSASSAALTGYSAEELEGTSPFQRMHPDDREAMAAFYGQILDGEGVARSRSTYRTLHKDGRWVWVEVTVALIRDDQGKAAEFISVSRDVTERTRLEEELQAARAAAEAAAAVKATFLANMSHEIRTPVTSILGFTNLLAAQKQLVPAVREHVARIAGAGQALLAVVNDVLDFSKLEAGQFEIAPQPAAPTELLHEAVLMFSPQAEAKGLTLGFTARNLPDWVLIDANRVRQVLLNLIGNAIKFTDSGSVRLAADYEPGPERLIVRVEDTGAGLTEVQQARLFLRFSQVDAASIRPGGGTGLGLAISKGLVEAMGGEIGVTSEVGVGSIFHIKIDAPVAEPPAPAPARDEAKAGALDRLCVLVVDDNAMNRELARAVLEPFGLEVFEAAGGRAAVAAAATRVFDVVLMDIRMPDLDGPATLAQMRTRDGPNRNTPVLAFTADADLGGLGAPVGFDGVVRKPIVAADLAEAIVGAVGRHSSPVSSHS